MHLVDIIFCSKLLACWNGTHPDCIRGRVAGHEEDCARCIHFNRAHAIRLQHPKRPVKIGLLDKRGKRAQSIFLKMIQLDIKKRETRTIEIHEKDCIKEVKRNGWANLSKNDLRVGAIAIAIFATLQHDPTASRHICSRTQSPTQPFAILSMQPQRNSQSVRPQLIMSLGNKNELPFVGVYIWKI